MKTKGKLLYKSKKALILYFVTFISLALAIFGTYYIIKHRQELIAEVDTVELGYLFFIFLLICCNAFLAVIWWIQDRYILEIWQEKDEIHIRTWSLKKTKSWNTYHRTIFKTKIYWDGDFEIGDRFVQTPTTWLKTPAGKKLILDHNGAFYESFLD